MRALSDPEARDPEERLGHETRLVILETPTNPLLHVHDIARWSRECDRVGAVLVVDNTFATPINQTPLALGADLVVESGTKYLGGHSDLVAGALVGPKRLVRRVDSMAYLGSTLDPFAAYLLSRSLKTLALRVERQNINGAALAAAVEHHPAVARVHYPGRASAEEERIASSQMRGRGGVVSILAARWGAGHRPISAKPSIRARCLEPRRGREPRQSPSTDLPSTPERRSPSRRRHRRRARSARAGDRGHGGPRS